MTKYHCIQSYSVRRTVFSVQVAAFFKNKPYWTHQPSSAPINPPRHSIKPFFLSSFRTFSRQTNRVSSSSLGYTIPSTHAYYLPSISLSRSLSISCCRHQVFSLLLLLFLSLILNLHLLLCIVISASIPEFISWCFLWVFELSPFPLPIYFSSQGF